MNKVLEFFIKAKDLSSDVIQRIVGKIHGWRDAATSAAKATADASKNSAASMNAVNDAMKRTSVNWKAIAQQEEDAKRRKKDLAVLERELKAATLEAGKASGEAAKMAQQRVDMLQKGINQMQQGATQDFNLMELGQNAITGNIVGMSKQVVQLAAKFKILGMSMASLSIYGLAIMAIVKIFTWWRDSINECEEKIRTIKMDGLTKQLEILDKAWKSVNDRMTDNMKLADATAKHMNALADASVAQQQAINNQKREQELAGTTDENERDRINRKYDSMNDALGIQGRKEKFARELEAEKDKLIEIENAIADNEMLKKRALAVKQKAVGDRTEAWEDSFDADDEDYKAANERVEKAQAKVREYADKLKALKEQADTIRNGITEKNAANGATLEQDKADAAKKAREAAEAEKKAAEAAKDEQDKLADELDDIWRDWYDAYAEYQKNKDSQIAKEKANLLAEYYDAMEAAEDDREREEIRAEYARQERELNFLKQFEDERLAKQKETEQARAEQEKENKKRQLAQDIADTKALLDEQKQAQAQAQARVQAAQAAVSQAWGWYRNKDSMKQYREQMDADVAARGQYEKDLNSLTRGRNADKLSEALYLSRRGETDKLEEQMAKWRKGAFGLSVEDEATMRVAIAKDEEKRANQALLDISENTANLGKILEVLQGGGGEE